MGEEVKPTVFPDKTSQVWKLPSPPKSVHPGVIDWRFEREDEIFVVAQLVDLFRNNRLELYVPYLPFARQDKEVSNETTFALRSFATLLNSLRFSRVEAVDVHNRDAARALIDQFHNISANKIHGDLIKSLLPDLIVFPDEGAKKRYPYLAAYGHVVFSKKRDQQSGRITGYDLVKTEGNPGLLVPGKRILVLDDLCDGGATFQFLAKELNANYKPAELDLFVTHGLFSKGRKPLEDAGYTLHTTNSLPRNPDGIPV